ncbi:hypothetical protein HDU97_005633 [Phlyctochytrium planicorne]|nr:hypothetical protein HDU97_005633 [Phlyctochytrium planicorne]
MREPPKSLPMRDAKCVDTSTTNTNVAVDSKQPQLSTPSAPSSPTSPTASSSSPSSSSLLSETTPKASEKSRIRAIAATFDESSRHHHSSSPKRKDDGGESLAKLVEKFKEKRGDVVKNESVSVLSSSLASVHEIQEKPSLAAPSSSQSVSASSAAAASSISSASTLASLAATSTTSTPSTMDTTTIATTEKEKEGGGGGWVQRMVKAVEERQNTRPQTSSLASTPSQSSSLPTFRTVPSSPTPASGAIKSTLPVSTRWNANASAGSPKISNQTVKSESTAAPAVRDWREELEHRRKLKLEREEKERKEKENAELLASVVEPRPERSVQAAAPAAELAVKRTKSSVPVPSPVKEKALSTTEVPKTIAIEEPKAAIESRAPIKAEQRAMAVQSLPEKSQPEAATNIQTTPGISTPSQQPSKPITPSPSPPPPPPLEIPPSQDDASKPPAVTVVRKISLTELKPNHQYHTSNESNSLPLINKDLPPVRESVDTSVSATTVSSTYLPTMDRTSSFASTNMFTSSTAASVVSFSSSVGMPGAGFQNVFTSSAVQTPPSSPISLATTLMSSPTVSRSQSFSPGMVPPPPPKSKPLGRLTRRVVEELIQTEKTFCEELGVFMEIYVWPLTDSVRDLEGGLEFGERICLNAEEIWEGAGVVVRCLRVVEGLLERGGYGGDVGKWGKWWVGKCGELRGWVGEKEVEEVVVVEGEAGERRRTSGEEWKEFVEFKAIVDRFGGDAAPIPPPKGSSVTGLSRRQVTTKQAEPLTFSLEEWFKKDAFSTWDAPPPSSLSSSSFGPAHVPMPPSPQPAPGRGLTPKSSATSLLSISSMSSTHSAPALARRPRKHASNSSLGGGGTGGIVEDVDPIQALAALFLGLVDGGWFERYVWYVGGMSGAQGLAGEVLGRLQMVEGLILQQQQQQQQQGGGGVAMGRSGSGYGILGGIAMGRGESRGVLGGAGEEGGWMMFGKKRRDEDGTMQGPPATSVLPLPLVQNGVGMGVVGGYRIPEGVMEVAVNVMRRALGDRRHGQVGMLGYLVLPFQRLTRYAMLFARLGETLESEYAPSLTVEMVRMAAEALRSVVESCNEAVRIGVGYKPRVRLLGGRKRWSSATEVESLAESLGRMDGDSVVSWESGNGGGVEGGRSSISASVARMMGSGGGGGGGAELRKDGWLMMVSERSHDAVLRDAGAWNSGASSSSSSSSSSSFVSSGSVNGGGGGQQQQQQQQQHPVPTLVALYADSHLVLYPLTMGALSSGASQGYVHVLKVKRGNASLVAGTMIHSSGVKMRRLRVVGTREEGGGLMMMGLGGMVGGLMRGGDGGGIKFPGLFPGGGRRRRRRDGGGERREVVLEGEEDVVVGWWKAINLVDG